MKRQLLASLVALVLAPGTCLAQNATPSAYTQGFNNYQLGDNIGKLVGGLRSESKLGASLGTAIGADPKSFCNQVGLGNNTSMGEGSGSNYDRGSTSSSSQGGGGISFFGIGGSGGGSGSDNKTWNRGSANSWKNASSTVVVGQDCSALLNSAAAIDMNQTNNDTQRLGIALSNETARYDIDKRNQVAIRQIEAGQIQTVFGNGAKSMMGDMAR